MKKVIFGLIATVLFLNLSSGQNTISYKEYGFYHNEALLEFTKKHGENQKDVSFIVDESIKLMQIKYPNIFKDTDGSEIKKLFEVQSANEFDYKKIWNSNKETFYKNNKISERVGDLIDKIVNNNSSYDEAIGLMNNFEKSNKLTLEETNGLIAVKSVLISSNEYWNQAKSSGTTEERHRAGSATLIADFAGAGMFMFAGPVAAICGFACSYITHQSDN